MKMFEEKPIDVIVPDKVELEVVGLSSAVAERGSGG